MTAFSRITAAEQLCNARVAATAPAPSAERQRQSWEERMASAPERRKVVRAACPHDCPDTCAMLVTVEDGKAIAIRGDPDHPTTGGALCTKVAHYLERTYSPGRVLYPMRRVGRKGEGRFARIGWDEALDEIATRFADIAASTDGPQAIL